MMRGSTKERRSTSVQCAESQSEFLRATGRITKTYTGIKPMVVAVALLIATPAQADIGADKWGHMGMGFACAAAFDAAWQRPVLGSVVCGVGKELYDSTGRGTVEAIDVVATVFGGIFYKYVTMRWVIQGGKWRRVR